MLAQTRYPFSNSKQTKRNDTSETQTDSDFPI